jgi:hypothetical protein
MALNEQDRHDLHTKLEVVLGRKDATTLMAHLPPVGWADVATKYDLAQLEERLEMRFASAHSELAAQIASLGSDLRREMADQSRAQTWRLMTLVVAMSSVQAALVGALVAVFH